MQYTVNETHVIEGWCNLGIEIDTLLDDNLLPYRLILIS